MANQYDDDDFSWDAITDGEEEISSSQEDEDLGDYDAIDDEEDTELEDELELEELNESMPRIRNRKTLDKMEKFGALSAISALAGIFAVLALIAFILMGYFQKKNAELEKMLAESETAEQTPEVIYVETPVETEIDTDSIRLYNGMVQAFVDGEWKDLLTMDEFSDSDPVETGRVKLQQMVQTNKDAVNRGELAKTEGFLGSVLTKNDGMLTAVSTYVTGTVQTTQRDNTTPAANQSGVTQTIVENPVTTPTPKPTQAPASTPANNNPTPTQAPATSTQTPATMEPVVTPTASPESTEQPGDATASPSPSASEEPSASEAPEHSATPVPEATAEPTVTPESTPTPATPTAEPEVTPTPANPEPTPEAPAETVAPPETQDPTPAPPSENGGTEPTGEE